MSNKLSIVISVYNSHEIVRRQLLHMRDFPCEVVIVDDNSNPPIEGARVRTSNKLAWTQGLGRNEGAEVATGEYILFTDIDHIISQNALDDALNFNGNKMIFRRQVAILDENGQIRQDRETLQEWGYVRDGLDASVHGNTFVVKRQAFLDIGGYDMQHSLIGYHPKSGKGDDCYFNAKWNRKYRGINPVVGRDIYMFPLGRFNKTGNLNPFNLFHNLDQSEEVRSYK